MKVTQRQIWNKWLGYVIVIMYSVEKDFDSVTKNITLKYSVCKFGIIHRAKVLFCFIFFSEKYPIMHRNSKVSADFWNGCIKTQFQFSYWQSKKTWDMLEKVEVVVLWTLETSTALIIDFFVK